MQRLADELMFGHSGRVTAYSEVTSCLTTGIGSRLSRISRPACLCYEPPQRRANFGGRVLLQEVPAFDGHFLLVFQGLAEPPVCAARRDNRSGFAGDEKVLAICGYLRDGRDNPWFLSRRSTLLYKLLLLFLFARPRRP
jgi:hypothetical protein